MPSPPFMKGFEKGKQIFAPENYDMHEQNWCMAFLDLR